MSKLFNRDANACGGDITLYQCPDDFPSSFCCSDLTTCLHINTNDPSTTAAICCPLGADCNTLIPVSCSQGEQDATQNPGNQLHSIPPQQLDSCGLGCCPMGYECNDLSMCIAQAPPSKISVKTTSTVTQRTSSTTTTQTKSTQSKTTQTTSTQTTGTQTKSTQTKSAPTSTSSAKPATDSHTLTSTAKILIAVLSIVTFLAVLALIAWYVHRRMKKSRESHEGYISFDDATAFAKAAAFREDKSLPDMPAELSAVHEPAQTARDFKIKRVPVPTARDHNIKRVPVPVRRDFKRSWRVSGPPQELEGSPVSGTWNHRPGDSLFE